jgi:hypothetical protein
MKKFLNDVYRLKGEDFFKIVILCIVAISVSCKTLKTSTNHVEKLSIEKICDSLINHDPVYKNLEIKFSVQYTGDKNSLDLKGTIKTVYDSVILITVSPGLGIEGARLMCNKDSLFILDRINKTYRASDYNYIRENWKVDVNFNSLQSILTGKLSVYPDVSNIRNEFITKFILMNDTNGLKAYRKNPDNIENLLKIDQSLYKVSQYNVSDGDMQRNLSIKYSFEKLNNGFSFPKNIVITSSAVGKMLQLDIEYTKIQINNNPTISFSVPSSFTKIGK